MVGGIISKMTLNRAFFKRMNVNLTLQLVFVCIMMGSSFYVANLATLVIFAFIIHVGAGFTFNNFFTYCLSRFPKNAGIASGLSGGGNSVFVSLLSNGVVFRSDERRLG